MTLLLDLFDLGLEVHFQGLYGILVQFVYFLGVSWGSVGKVAGFLKLFDHQIYSALNEIVVLLSNIHVALMMSSCLSHGFLETGFHVVFVGLRDFVAVSNVSTNVGGSVGDFEF